MLKKYKLGMNKNKRSLQFKTMAVAAVAGLGLMGTKAQAQDTQPTLDKIRENSTEYLNGTHTLYDLATEKGEHTSSITIGGVTYYYTPQSSEAAALTDLVNTGASALVETGSSAGAVFSLTDPETSTTKYYTYNTDKLPQSVYSATESTVDDYTYSLQTSEGTKYFKVDLNTSRMGSDNVTWTKVAEAGENTVEVKIPHNDTTVVEYYQYTGTPTERVNNSETLAEVTGNHVGGYSSSYGGAINNSGSIGSITGNIIGLRSSSGTYSRGGGIYNTGTIGSITGDFVGNYASPTYSGEGGAIYNGSGSIGSITGDFIGNHLKDGYASSNGGAIYNNASIGDIEGNFIRNYTELDSDGRGGAIYNAYSGIINNIKVTLSETPQIAPEVKRWVVLYITMVRLIAWLGIILKILQTALQHTVGVVLFITIYQKQSAA